MSIRKPFKTIISKDSGVQTDFEDDDDYQSNWPLLKNTKHVQYTNINNDGSKPDLNDKTNFKPTQATSGFFKWALEPFMFTFMFSYMMFTSCLTNMMLDKACLNHLNYSSEICKNLSAYPEEKDNVERIGNVYSQYNTLIHMGIGALAMIFIGPWSDRYGRKLPLIISVVGALLHDGGLILNTIYFEWPLDYLILSSLPFGIVGGMICTFSIVYSMASEITTEKIRTLKYAILELCFTLGLSLGALSGGYLYDEYSYEVVYIVTAVGHAISFVWAIVAIRETRELTESKSASWKEKLGYMFSFTNLTTGFKACIKLRPNYGRTQIWLLMIAMCPMIITYASISSIAYIYVHHMYNWGPSRFAEVNTIFSCVGIVVSVFFIPITIKLFKLDDPILGFIGTVSMAAKNICIAFSTHTGVYYLGNLLGLFSGISMLSVRSRMSKLVEKDELGKVFTFLATCESLVPVVGTIGMTYLFNASLSYFPGLTYLVAGVLLIFPAIFFLWMAQLKPLPVTVVTTTDVQNNDISKS